MRIRKAEQVERERRERMAALAPAPVRYSKYRVYQKLRELGLWARVKAHMEESGLEDAWMLCQELDPADPQFQAGLEAFRALFPDVDVESALDECRA